MGRDAGSLADALGIGFVLPACTVAGFLGGRWLGRVFSIGPAAAVGGALGAVAGFWYLFVMIRRIDRRGGS